MICIQWMWAHTSEDQLGARPHIGFLTSVYSSNRDTVGNWLSIAVSAAQSELSRSNFSHE